MKKLFYLFLIFFPVLMPCGCSDIDDSSLAEYGNNTYIVTDAEVCRYAYGTSTEFEVMLFLDGCSLDSPYGSMVYFGLDGIYLNFCLQFLQIRGNVLSLQTLNIYGIVKPLIKSLLRSGPLAVGTLKFVLIYVRNRRNCRPAV